ncbi:MAG: preprotein translocase subunit SecG [Hyphomicrobiales bacterium]
MSTVLLVIHLMIAAALVGVVLLQRSEGGALGIGGGGGGGGFMTGRGTANLLTRVTAVLAVAFFATSILLTIVARQGTAPRSLLDSLGTSQPQGQSQPGPLLPSPQAPAEPSGPQAPQSR